jgi:2-polyprenyl-3-methyl-5-hydroxy-6-metoxy-1,4-benzoquinol methylase
VNFSRRDILPELIDLGPDHYTPGEYRDSMVKLGRVGRWLGGDRAGIAAFRSLSPPPDSIIDVGCGGGWFTRRLAVKYPGAMVVGEDVSAEAINLARDRHRHPNLSFRVSGHRAFEAEEDSVDVVTATLVCHHLEDAELIAFLRNTCRAARRAVILNDLHRHPLAHASFSVLAPLLFRNRLICHDGPLSVRKGFSRGDWHRLIAAAGIEPGRYSITWRWAFRWVVLIETDG